MRFALISDTHGNYPLAVHALGQIVPVDLLIHLGDGCKDLDLIAAAVCIPTCYAVAGNCDGFSTFPRELSLSLSGKNVLALHGDHYRVKFGLTDLIAHAKENHADLVAFGHTHFSLVTVIDGILFVNPGSLAKTEKHPTIAVVTITDGTITAEIIPVLK